MREAGFDQLKHFKEQLCRPNRGCNLEREPYAGVSLSILYLTWTVTNLIKSFFIHNRNNTYFDGVGGCVSKIGSRSRGGYVYKYDFSWLGKSAEG